MREAQLKLYQEGQPRLRSPRSTGSPDWIKARQEFLRLYYGRYTSKASIMRPRAVKYSRSNAP